METVTQKPKRQNGTELTNPCDAIICFPKVTFPNRRPTEAKRLAWDCCGEPQTCAYWPADGFWWRLFCCKPSPQEKSGIEAVFKIIGGLIMTGGGAVAIISTVNSSQSSSSVPPTSVSQTPSTPTPAPTEYQSQSNPNQAMNTLLIIIAVLTMITGLQQMFGGLSEFFCTPTKKHDESEV